MPVVNAQFHFFDHMFNHAAGGGQRMRQEEPSDSARYQSEWKAANCDKYLCPGTLACVASENKDHESQKADDSQSNTAGNISSVLHDTDPSSNSLLAPVHIPEDPHAILKSTHPAASILANSGLVVQRQLEMMNVLIGFEQANRYIILDGHGNHVGYMAEQDNSIGNTIARQWAGTHRSVVTWVFDRHGKEVLR
ncbi:hypothetical protein KEM56_001926, partial [Ascosphaera pollenicola]